MTRAPEGAVTVDDGEIHEHQWIRPAEAMARRDAGEIELIPPTWMTLRLLTEHPSVDATLAAARAREPQIYVTHIARVDGGIASIWQGDAAYDDLDTSRPGTAQPPPDARRRVAGRDLLTRALTARCGAPIRRDRPRSVTGSRPPSTRFRVVLEASPGPVAAGSTAPTCPWARRLVVVVTGVALLAVACSDGGGSGNAQTHHHRPGQHRRHRRTAAPTTTPKKIDTIPGMPGVPDPSNLYSETATGKMSDAVKNALAARVRAEPRVEHGVGDRSVDDEGRRHLRRGVEPAARGAQLGPQDAVGHQQRRGHSRRLAHAHRPDHGQARRAGDRRRPLQHVLHARREVRDQRGRGPQAARLPRPAHDEGGVVARRTGLRGCEPRRLHHRRPVRDLHLRVRRAAW